MKVLIQVKENANTVRLCFVIVRIVLLQSYLSTTKVLPSQVERQLLQSNPRLDTTRHVFALLMRPK